MEGSNGDNPLNRLTDEERNFAIALTNFFQALEYLSMTRGQIKAAGGSEMAAFLSTIPEEQRGLAAAQWPMLSMVLDSIPSTLG